MKNLGVMIEAAVVGRDQNVPFFEVFEGIFDSDSAASKFCVTNLLGDRQRTILGFFAAKLPPPNARFKTLIARSTRIGTGESVPSVLRISKS